MSFEKVVCTREKRQLLLIFLSSYAELKSKRKEHFGFYLSNNLSEFEKADTASLSYFVERSIWF